MNPRSRLPHRSGAILVVALVMAAVTVLVVGTALRQTLRVYRSTVLSLRKPQAHLLVDAGIERAVERLGEQPEYRGETWDVSAAFEGGMTAIIEITIAPVDAENAVEITVAVRLAELSTVALPGIQQTHTLTHMLSKPTLPPTEE